MKSIDHVYEFDSLDTGSKSSTFPRAFVIQKCHGIHSSIEKKLPLQVFLVSDVVQWYWMH